VGTRRLTLLRHGKAQSIDACAEDFERVLTHRGAIEAKEMASRLVYRDLVPDLILVSPAERAWRTAELVAAACELEPKQIQCARELYLAAPETVWNIVARCGSSLRHLMICGHNPGLSQIASRFGPTPQRRELPTAGIATAAWYDVEWSSVQPETAKACELDDPESMADLWA
jgi:phosphohistidine phosphatase